jgi:hypothetical protein
MQVCSDGDGGILLAQPHGMNRSSALLVVVLVSGCAAQPLEKPIELGPVNTGTGSLEQVRRQFAGRWDLVSLEVRSASGEVQRPKSVGSLTYDEYGNLRVVGEIQEPVENLQPGLLKYEGRAVIDPVKSELRLLDVTGDGMRGESAAALVAPSSVRHFRFEGPTLLHISIVNEHGEPTATTVWRRANE